MATTDRAVTEELTDERVIDDPLLLLNERRELVAEFFERRLRQIHEGLELVGDALALLGAMRRVLTVYSEAARLPKLRQEDVEQLRAGTDELAAVWEGMAPLLQTTFRVVPTRADPSRCRLDPGYLMPPETPLWSAGNLGSAVDLNLWMRLRGRLPTVPLGELPPLLVCDGCGRITQPQPRGRHQRFCSDACRKRTWDRENR